MKADLSAIQAETVAVLQQLIRMNSVNPPGNELPVGLYIDERFKAEEIDSTVLMPADNRAAVIARVKGNGSKRPVLLLAHMDVVSVEADKWTCDPFGGIVRDGYVYGRGAIDDKGMLAANMMTMMMLRRQQRSGELSLERDVVFVATSDEEGGGAHGIKWLVDNHRDLLDAEFGINEGGRTRIVEDGKRYLAIQVAEKISHMVKMTARGPAGHASVPTAGNAVFRLSHALEKLSHHVEPLALLSTTREFFHGLASIWSNTDQRAAMQALGGGDAHQQMRAAETLAAVPVFNAVMRNTISPTILSAGTQGNVIPAEANVELNVRTVPGHSIDGVVQRIVECISDSEVEVTVSARGSEANPSDETSPMYYAIADSAKVLDPEIAVVPYLSTGATDSSALRRIGINCYGLLPFAMVPNDEERMHGHDERVPIDSLHFGTRLIHEAVRRVAEKRN